MSYDEQAARRVVEERVEWAVRCSVSRVDSRVSIDAGAITAAILAAKMLDQLPMVVPETPNDEMTR